ncbi:MAG: hypothetical protein M3Q56_11720 [Bacteroidota bacterium]|nr:hypothetical protein [Bacteroidota bacterium]
MKLRTAHNSLRLRINQLELETLRQAKKLFDYVQFTEHENDRIEYEIRSSLIPEILVQFAKNRITVEIPEFLFNQWTETDLVGIDHTIVLTDGLRLFVLIEKDFKCLTPRMNEDEALNFENPLSEC